LIVAIVALCCLAVSDSALAQCVMCRSSFAGNVRNFNLAVLVLLAPPVSIFCAIFIIAYRHRKR
jgi:hypothetical protein